VRFCTQMAPFGRTVRKPANFVADSERRTANYSVSQNLIHLPYLTLEQIRSDMRFFIFGFRSGGQHEPLGTAASNVAVVAAPDDR
jgi:hypothetical protein